VLIDFFFTIRNSTSLFDLLAGEKNLQSSDEYLNELSMNFEKPTFKLSMNKDFKHFYQEYELVINEQGLILIVYYKHSDDSFNVSLKLKHCQKSLLLSYSSLIFFEEDISKNKIHSFVTICNNKSQTNIFKIENFKKYSKENFTLNKKHNINLCVLMKPCNMHSAFSTHLAINFNRNYQDLLIRKVNKQFLQTLLKNDFINKENEDSVVIAVSNWCNINIFHE